MDWRTQVPGVYNKTDQGSENFLVQNQIVNILGSVGHMSLQIA
jgi:hypothetical protein